MPEISGLLDLAHVAATDIVKCITGQAMPTDVERRGIQYGTVMGPEHRPVRMKEPEIVDKRNRAAERLAGHYRIVISSCGPRIR